MDSTDSGRSESSSSLDSDEETRFSEYILSSSGQAALEAENDSILKIYDAINRNKLRSLSKKLHKNNINANNDIIADIETGDKVSNHSKKSVFSDDDSDDEESDDLDVELSSTDSDVEVILAPVFPELLKWISLSKFSKDYFKITIPSSMNEALDYYGIYTLHAPSTFVGTVVRTTIQGIYFSASGITNSIVSLTKWFSLLVSQRRNHGELKL